MNGNGHSPDIFQRIGALEVVQSRTDSRLHTIEKADGDKEVRIRKLEHLTAKVVGGAVVGASLGSWLLSHLSFFIK